MKAKKITKEDVIRTFILDKSEELFIRNGFEKTSMDMIAAACDLSKPTLYNYFPCKNDLFMDVHVRLHERINDTILEHLKKDKDRLAVLEEIVDSTVRMIGEHRDFLRVFNREYHHLTHENLSEHIDWTITNRKTMSRVFTRFLDGIVQAEVKKSFAVESLASIILSMFDMLFFDLAVNESDRIETYKELLFYILKNSVLKSR
jgi:AcrR family transcriptional regulator